MTSSLHKRIGGMVVLVGATSLYLSAQGINPIFSIQSLSDLINTSSCGNGIKEYGESCDDGNLNDSDACGNNCQIRKECQKEHLAAAPLGCRYEFNRNSDGCQESYLLCNIQCGDGKTNQATEECDDGNTVDTDFCSNSCKKASCGDGMVQQGEQCDRAIEGDQCGAGYTCSECDCLKPKYCGDGIVNQNTEICDDGNTNNSDGCSTLCKPCDILLLPDAPLGCSYHTSYNENDCPIQRLVCEGDYCSNGLEKGIYQDCLCPEGTYLEQAQEYCIIDPVTELASCSPKAVCVAQAEVFTTQSIPAAMVDTDDSVYIQANSSERDDILLQTLDTKIEEISATSISVAGKRLQLKRLSMSLKKEVSPESDAYQHIDSRIKEVLLKFSEEN